MVADKIKTFKHAVFYSDAAPFLCEWLQLCGPSDSVWFWIPEDFDKRIQGNTRNLILILIPDTTDVISFFWGGAQGTCPLHFFKRPFWSPAVFTIQKPCYAIVNKDTSSTRTTAHKLKPVSMSLDPPTSSSFGSAVSCVIGCPHCYSILLAHWSASCPGVLINLPLLSESRQLEAL